MAGLVDLLLDRRRNDRATQEQTERSRGVRELTGRAPVNLEGIEGLFPAEQASAGRGLLADPADLGRQTRFAAGLEQLPGGGGGLLGQVLTGGQAGQRQGAALEQRESEFGRTMLQRVEEFRAQDLQFAAGGAKRAADLQRAEQQLVAGEREAQQAALNNPFEAFSPLHAKMDGSPNDGFVRVDPKDFAVQQAKHDSTGTLLSESNRAMELLDMFGTELWNDDFVGEFRNLWGDMILRASSLREAGAPQGAELDISEGGLPDPTGLFNQAAGVLPGMRNRFIKSYQTFGDQVTDRFISQLGINPTLATNLDLVGGEYLEKRGIDEDMWQFVRDTKGIRR